MSPPLSSPCCPAHDWRRLHAQDLPAATAERMRQHLEECASCRQVFEEVQGDTSTDAASPRGGWGETTARGEAKPLVPPSKGATAEELRARFPFLSPPLEEGEVGWLGSYRIVGVLGEGGMGVVFDAEDAHLRRRVALKVLRPELGADLVSRQRFLQEARAAAALPGDHIVTIYQVGMADDVPFLAMQYLQGESLEQRLQREERLPAAAAVRVAREVAEGLALAHEAGLIHRDVKPANIWLETVPLASTSRSAPFHLFRAKLLDFGLARPASAPSGLTSPGAIVGTPHYLAPEQARGQALDARCDLFSLGCVLFRMLAGKLPFDGPDMLSLLTALAVEEPPPVADLVPGTPPELSDLVGRLLAKDPAGRPASARDVVECLQALEQQLTAPVSPPPPPSGTPALPPREPRRRSWRRTVLVGAGLVLVLSAGAWLLGKKGQAQPADGPAGEPIKVGVLFSLSGTLSSSGSAVTDSALLAIDEINERGGVLGRPVVPVVVDGASDSHQFARLAEWLITRENVCTVVGCWASASRKTVRPIFEKHDHLLLYPVQYEGLEASPNIVYLGAAPNQQILPALRYATGMLRKRRLFLVGSDYVFPRTANAILRDALAKSPEVRVVGEQYLPLGSTEVHEAVEAIVASKADLIVNTINGDTNAAFFRALRRAGVQPGRTPTLSFSIGENELRSLNEKRMVGDYAAWNYFQSVDRPQNAAFVARFRARYGPQRVVSDPMEAAYTGLHLWAQAVQAAGSTEPRAIRQALKGQAFDAPGGRVHIDPENQHAWKVVRVGRIVAGGQFDIVWSSEKPIRPEPFPHSRTRRQWKHFLDDLFRGWGGHWEAPNH